VIGHTKLLVDVLLDLFGVFADLFGLRETRLFDAASLKYAGELWRRMGVLKLQVFVLEDFSVELISLGAW